MENFDIAVIGVGGMGSAALYHLAKSGAKVCGIEQFVAGHGEGSSHGDTRIIRKAYPEAPDYIPLLNRSYELWKNLEAVSGETLLNLCGFLVCGSSEGEYLSRVQEGADKYDVTYQYLDRQLLQKRFPQFHLPDNFAGFLDPEGGIVYVEKGVYSHVAAALENGAILYGEEVLLGWEKFDGNFLLKTSKRLITTEKIVFTTGAWAVDMMAALNISLEVWRRVIFWHDCKNMAPYYPDQFPSFVINDERSPYCYYGCPAINERGLKLGEHDVPLKLTDPFERNMPLTDEEVANMNLLLENYLPDLNTSSLAHKFCMYTISPDHHFIMDQHPEIDGITIACGFSGHGYKFAPVVGEILSSLALTGSSGHEIDFLGIGRFQ